MIEGKKVLTGVKPTGKPHLGNYFGAIKPAIEMGKTAKQHIMFIADYHAINAEKRVDVLNKEIKEIACIYLAAGLDPKKSIFYRQSDVPEIFEMTTILTAFTPKGFMNKAHAYKAAVDKNVAAGKPNDDGINMGLYTYPILMAADILSFDTDIDIKIHCIGGYIKIIFRRNITYFFPYYPTIKNYSFDFSSIDNKFPNTPLVQKS